MLSVTQALILTAIMGAVIFACRALPFLLFRGGGEGSAGGKSRLAPLLALAERVAPPVTMTVLAFNAVAAPIRENPRLALPVLIPSIFTALVHLWKRNTLISIIGGTLLYMILGRLL
jgi:branched-subunit amino acid transport protein AzlD